MDSILGTKKCGQKTVDSILGKKNCGQKQYTQFLVQILRTRIVDSILGINIVENKCIKYLVQKMWTKIVDSILDINTVNKKKHYIQFWIRKLSTKHLGKNSTFNSWYITCEQKVVDYILDI